MIVCYFSGGYDEDIQRYIYHMKIKNLLFSSVPDRDKNEFITEIYKTDIVKVKITSIIFIIIEVIMLTAYSVTNRNDLFRTPDAYYGIMYIIMIPAMTVFLLVFIRFSDDIPDNKTGIRYAGLFFISFILIWCAGISLLDQLSNGQVIVYVVAVISIAVTPVSEPLMLFITYSVIHSVFLLLMPYFQKSAGMVFANGVNSTAFLVISWAIGSMRYRKYADDFNNKKLIREKTGELILVNKKLEEANQKLEILSRTDSLTGLYNRFMFDQKIKEEWNRCKRHSISLSLIMADIDYFKNYNDQYGHHAGDCCLRKIAEILASCAGRSSDTVARYGGEEFAVLLPHMDEKNALEFAEQIRKKVEITAGPNTGLTDPITINLGVHTMIPSDMSSIDEFIINTDKALYKAKEKRNCCEAYSAGFQINK